MVLKNHYRVHMKVRKNIFVPDNLRIRAEILDLTMQKVTCSPDI